MAKKSKKLTVKKSVETAPMPSIIYHEATVDSPTPQADQIEKELLETKAPPQMSDLPGYNPSAKRLMWVAVISLTVVICVMWSWSIYFQLSSVKWSQNSEVSLWESTRQNWQNSFRDQNGNRLSSEEQVNSIKNSLSKLFAGAAASPSSTTSTPEVTTSTP